MRATELALTRHQNQSWPIACRVTPGESKDCSGYPPALALLIHLRQSRGDVEVFPIVPDTEAPALRQSPNTVRKARDYLIAKGLLAPVIQSHGKRPSLFRLAEARP